MSRYNYRSVILVSSSESIQLVTFLKDLYSKINNLNRLMVDHNLVNLWLQVVYL